MMNVLHKFTKVLHEIIKHLHEMLVRPFRKFFPDKNALVIERTIVQKNPAKRISRDLYIDSNGS